MAMVFIQGAGGGKPEEEKTVVLELQDGDQAVTPSNGKMLSKVTIEKPTTLTPENVKNGITIAGVTGTLESDGNENDLNEIIDGTLTTFKMPDGITKIASYRFYSFYELSNVDLTGATDIGAYAFYQCSGIKELILSPTIQTVAAYAFSKTENSECFLEIKGSENLYLDSDAFSNSSVRKVQGSFRKIGSGCFSSCKYLLEADIECTGLAEYAFRGCDALTTVSLKINGALGTQAFYDAYAVNSFNLSPDSVITSLANYAFAIMGGKRNYPEKNIIKLDFRNSTFPKIGDYSFGSNSVAYFNTYYNVWFPKTVTAIGNYAFASSKNCNYYFTSSIPPTIQSSIAWDKMYNINLFVPHNKINEYRIATNWALQSSCIKGFTEEGTFTEGQELPLYNAEGYKLTWYSDPACTMQVTTIADPTAMYYCIAGNTRQANRIVELYQINCTVTITDGERNYAEGDSIPIGTHVTIQAEPYLSNNLVYVFRVNGKDIENGATIINDDTVKDFWITACFYNGKDIPLKEIFSDNTWDMIQRGFKDGIASQFWHPGDEKQIVLMDGNTTTLRIADMQARRYELADESGYSNGVLEFTNSTIEKYKMNQTATNIGGWADSYIKTTVMPILFSNLPIHIQRIISKVNVLSAAGGVNNKTVSSSANDLFIPSIFEITGEKSASLGDKEGTPQFDYYRLNSDMTYRIKKPFRSAVGEYYWTRSPYTGDSNYAESCFIGIMSNGRIDPTLTVLNDIRVAPIFAI